MNEDDDRTYVSLENSWDIHPNENLLAKYWAAKEMANTISTSFHELDEEYGYVFIVDREYLNNLVQILKKEWFK